MYAYTAHMNTKQQVRDDIKKLFSRKDREELILKNAIIWEKILVYIRENDVQNICIYESMSDEVGTSKLIETLKRENKNIYTPQMIGETEMILIDDDYWVYEKEIELFIIPWRAFNQSWKRLGRGKWYYDRLLWKWEYKKSIKLGICYDFQVYEDIKTQKHDIDMNTIITNTSC